MKSYENDKRTVLYEVPKFRVRCISGHKCKKNNNNYYYEMQNWTQNAL